MELQVQEEGTRTEEMHEEAECDNCGYPRPEFVCSYRCGNCGYYQDCSDPW